MSADDDALKLCKPTIANYDLGTGKKPSFPDVEEELFALLLDNRLHGKAVNHRWIRNAAKEIYSQQKLRGDVQSIGENLTADFMRPDLLVFDNR